MAKSMNELAHKSPLILRVVVLVLNPEKHTLAGRTSPIKYPFPPPPPPPGLKRTFHEMSNKGKRSIHELSYTGNHNR